jgi:hypothetical protein
MAGDMTRGSCGNTGPSSPGRSQRIYWPDRYILYHPEGRKKVDSALFRGIFTIVKVIVPVPGCGDTR